jgi:FlaG/FlaF family flagellin (archaellin)
MSKILTRGLKNNDNAIAPIIGALLITLLTIVLASLTAVTLYDSDVVQSLRNAFGGTPRAVIEIEGIVGGIHSPPDTATFGENTITLVHKSGDPLALDQTLIIITGNGDAFVGTVGGTHHYEKGDVVVKYVDLTPTGKLPKYRTRNPAVDDGYWSTGEQLTLNGEDSINGTHYSTVYVTANGITNTSNNYGFKADTIVTVKVFDEKSDCIIAEDTAFVHLAE